MVAQLMDIFVPEKLAGTARSPALASAAGRTMEAA
jgi:hypothetical protein